MKKEWEYEGKKYIIYDDRKGNLYLNCHLCDCADVLKYVDSEDKSLSEKAKCIAKEMVFNIEHGRELRHIEFAKYKIDKTRSVSDVIFISDTELSDARIKFSKFDCKEWQYEKRKYIMHWDFINNRYYLNGHLCKHPVKEYIWFNVDSADESHSWRAKHRAKEIEIARLEAAGVEVYPRYKQQWYDKLIFYGVGAIVVGFILYFIFTLWWIFIGDSLFNGPFEYTTGEGIGLTILFFIALICVLSDVIMRIIRGHF